MIYRIFFIFYFVLIGTATAQDIVVPANDWVKVLSKDEGGQFHLVDGSVFYWVTSTAKPNYADCSRGRRASSNDAPFIGVAPNEIWVCTAVPNKQVIVTVNKSLGDFSR